MDCRQRAGIKHPTEWDYLKNMQQYREKDEIKKTHVKEIIDGIIDLPKVYPFMSMADYQQATRKLFDLAD